MHVKEGERDKRGAVWRSKGVRAVLMHLRTHSPRQGRSVPNRICHPRVRQQRCPHPHAAALPSVAAMLLLPRLRSYRPRLHGGCCTLPCCSMLPARLAGVFIAPAAGRRLPPPPAAPAASL